MSELKQFRLPDVGEGLTEADIVRWLVKPGDHVVINQIIVEIETAKAVVELPSPFEGVVAELYVPEGTTADVGTPIIAVDVSPSAGADPADQGAAAVAGTRGQDLVPPPPVDRAIEPGMHGSPAPKAERQAVLVGYGVKLGTTVRRPRKPRAEQAHPAAGPAPADRQRARHGKPEPRKRGHHRPPPGPRREPGGAGQASGPQAGPGPGRGPVRAFRHRPERLDHPR